MQFSWIHVSSNFLKHFPWFNCAYRKAKVNFWMAPHCLQVVLYVACIADRSGTVCSDPIHVAWFLANTPRWVVDTMFSRGHDAHSKDYPVDTLGVDRVSFASSHRGCYDWSLFWLRPSSSQLIGKSPFTTFAWHTATLPSYSSSGFAWDSESGTTLHLPFRYLTVPWSWIAQ